MPKVMTLAIIRDSRRVLLGLKKRGFGAGRWNGFGGKVDVGETIEEAAKRELLEECCISTDSLKKFAIIEFEFEGEPELMQVHLFSISKYTGEPRETEEMRPQWFPIDQIPFDRMWPDDIFWYPLFLEGKCFRGYMKFRGVDELLNHKLLVVPDESSLNITFQDEN